MEVTSKNAAQFPLATVIAKVDYNVGIIQEKRSALLDEENERRLQQQQQQQQQHQEAGGTSPCRPSFAFFRTSHLPPLPDSGEDSDGASVGGS
jgi:hypothetical protein